jgi:TRAP-type transport system periplasmic protein
MGFKPKGSNAVKISAVLLIVIVSGFFSASLAADYKREFKMSVVPHEQTAWGRAANRFASAIKYRTEGRILIKNYFDAQLVPGRQTTEFDLVQQGLADFVIGSTINWSQQIKQLNLFALPFLFPNYTSLDAVETGEPGKQLFELIKTQGVVPIAWGENGFRELTNSKRSIRRPEDLLGLDIRVVGMPIFVDIFQALGANPVSMSFDEAQTAFREGKVDGQENPVALIIPYKLWEAHRYVTLWHYTIDPLILAASAKTWLSFRPEDRKILQNVGEEVMAEQKKEAREELEHSHRIIDNLQKIYGMNVAYLSPDEIEAFREKTRIVYAKWTEEIGFELVHSAEKLVGSTK